MPDTVITALVVPPEGQLRLLRVPASGLQWVYDTLKCTTVQAIPFPDLDKHGLTAYCDEEGLHGNTQPCHLAMDYFLPVYGYHPWWGGVAICGFDPRRGEHVDRDPLASRRLKTVIAESGRELLDLREDKP